MALALPGDGQFANRPTTTALICLILLSTFLTRIRGEELLRIDSSNSNEMLLDWDDRNSNNNNHKVEQYREFSAGKGERGLFPSIFNLATHAEIRATATCGQNGGPDYYCKLVEHVFLRQPQCDICDANNHHKNHPIDYAIDGTRRWWQSPTLSNGLSFERVNITLDLRQIYQVAYVIIKAAISPRPGTWVLEKSLDGVDFQPWQFFAASDSECMRVFGQPASTGVPKFARDDEVLCTSYFSKLNPLEDGEIHISLVNGRPGAEKSSQSLQQFTKTRFVRLRLLGLKTLYADLMVINQRDKKLDHSVTRRYFYTISDISIGGQCICYGHAERCTPDIVHGQFRCECRHNTCGESCSECCPLFNQLPWRVGTHDHPNVCQACQCFNHAHRCAFDSEVERQKQSVTPEGIFEGGGKCVDCQHNTEGINCEKCMATFYRPANISHYRHDACRPCDCDPDGSESSSCVRDETEAFDGLRPGDCRCRPGFGGRRCDRCAIGFRNHPVCEPCPCDQAGSLNFETCDVDQGCVCKPNVEGERCDRCRPGTLYLDRENPLGCQPCFCFGISQQCREHSWSTSQISHPTGWNLTDLHGQLDVPQPAEADNPELLIFNAEDLDRPGQHLYYWKAPAPMLGNRLNSFGAALHYFVYFVPREPSQGQPTPIADIVIEGNGAKLEFYSRLNFFPRENISVSVPLKPADNWYDARTRRPVDKAAMMRVLADVTALWVRARYHQDQLQSSIYGFRVETAYDPVAGPPAGIAAPVALVPLPSQRARKVHPVEMCTCPEHFEGNSCELCAPGYRRVNAQLYDGSCKRCECQGHSDRCDPFTGHCLNCQHNTTGARCELCLPGFFGNPSLGGLLGQCRPCACPTVDHSHSAECTLSQLVLDGAAAVGQDEYVCTACEPGYDGNKCEICADGFFGDPFAADPAQACRACECSGNIDPAAIGNCDPNSGECLRCIGHTTGPDCASCLPNHWGSALAHSCQPCRCHSVGAHSAQCSNQTGECECRPGYTGARCDRCEFGHGDVDNGCPECQCNEVGSLGAGCDEVSGQCVCKKGVMGLRCDMCVPAYYNFGPDGCQFCHCHELGALPGQECHNVTGECQCQPHVEGRKCERCAEGFFNLTGSGGRGCQFCNCDSTGALDEKCNERTGQCRCKNGVTGLKCDKCEPNFYGFSPDGCKQCRVCPAIGQVCDPVSGECVCPPNTRGEMCESCVQTAWNYHPYRGCQLCECDGIGADSQLCDQQTGQCKCRTGFVGHRCDQCEPGHHGFPECRACECHLGGTDPAECRGTVCLCSPQEGQCKCRKNVVGIKCDQCADNAFSLEAWNPQGCTECFCFGRSSQCRQAPGLVWRQTYAPDRRVVFETPFEMYERRHNLHVLKEWPSEYNSYPTNHTPLYWPMPDSFRHDRTGSYGGFLRFRIRNDDNRRSRLNVQPDQHTFRLFPQVVLIGSTRIELEYVPSKSGGEEGKYRVRLHESQWRNRVSPQVPVTRKQFMVALLNVQHIFVRATYNDMYRGDAISIGEVSLDVATEGAEEGEGAPPALGVEECMECAEGWTGRSCQEPAPGWHIWYEPGFVNKPDDIVLAGVARPCACHGHSGSCDPKSGECIECQHNTEGTHCERCKDGFYGNALSGSPEACHRCACPLADSNTFSPTCRPSQSSGRGYVCDACRPGYTGDYCENCEPGYYGNPALAGGFCALCACHPHGSLNAICHNVTGQCQCRQGVDGRDCSLCSPRHAFLNGVCTSCDRGCYRELMLMEDEMEYSLGPVRSLLSETRPIPRKRLARIQTAVATLDSLLDTIGGGGGELTSSADTDLMLWPGLEEEDADGLGDVAAESRPLKQARLLEQEFQLLQERNNESGARLTQLEAEMAELRRQVQTENRRVVDIVNQLAQFARRAAQASPSQVNYMLGQAHALVNGSRDRVASIEKKYNYAKKNAEEADRLLKEIMARKLNSTSYTHLADQHAHFAEQIRDFRNALWDRARAGSLAAKNLSQLAGSELDRLQRTIDQIGQFGQLAKEEVANGLQNVEQIGQLGQQIGDIQKELADSLIPAARTQREEVIQPLEGQLEEAASKTAEAEAHARELEQQAAKLKGRFAETQIFSMDALAASNAYQSIVSALQDAASATAAAKRNADDAFAVVDPQAEGSLASLANASAAKSAELNRQVAQTLESLGVREQNARLEKTLEELGERMRGAQKNMSLVKDVQQLLEDHHDRISTVYTAVDEAHDGLGAIEEAVTEFNTAVEELRQRADTVQQFTSASIRDSIRNLSASQAELGELETAFQQLRGRSDDHAAQFGQVRSDLGVLKEKIDEAREKAAKIRIGVRAEPGSGCVREYISPMRPTASNTISIKYRPAMDSPDSLIFFTQVPATRTQSREYLSVELRQKKIRVKWDIGGGHREAFHIKRNLVYIPASDRFTWYHIELKRVANTMKVKVVKRQALGGEGSRDVDEPTELSVGEPDVSSNVIFNVIPGQTRLSLGLKEAKLAEDLGLGTHHFHGTVGELNVDGLNVPLWVFASTVGACDGATGPPAKMASGHMFRDGFAQVRLPMSERTSTMLTVQFSAYSPNGLLYFRGSPSTGEFLALELNEGIVALKADFGPEAKFVVQSNHSRYADGRAHKVRVIRQDRQVHLQMEGTDHQHYNLTDGQAVLDIAEPDHFVAGVPPDFPRAEFLQDHDIQFDGFFGCIHSVRPNQVSELDLDNPLRAQRKEPGCRYREERLGIEERVIGFQGQPGGFLKNRGFLLDTDSTFSFNLRTKSGNALLLFQSADLQREERAQKARKRRRRTMRRRAGSSFLEAITADHHLAAAVDERGKRALEPEDESFLAIYLLEGRLHVSLGTDMEHRSLIISTQMYNDGLLHSVFLSRSGKDVQVRVDDREVMATDLEDERPIGGDQWTMVLGGLPTRMANLLAGEAEMQLPELAAQPLAGCLSDLQLNYDRLPILLEEHRGASLGSCPLEDGTEELETHQQSSSGVPGPAADEKPTAKPFGEEEEPTTDGAAASLKQFHRKKSRQSLEPVAPTLQQQPRSLAASKDSHSMALAQQCSHQAFEAAQLAFGDEAVRRQGLRFGVAEASHARVNFPEKPYPDPANFSVSFEFRAAQPKRAGLLWVWASYRNYSRFFVLHMDRRGFVQLEMKGHRQQPASLHFRGRRFNDGQWHRLGLEKRERRMRLWVDEEAAAEELDDAPNARVMRRRMYVGGVISKHRRVFLAHGQLPPGFQGCIRNFRVDGAERDLQQHSRDLLPCYQAPDSAYIHAGGFATFASLAAQQKKQKPLMASASSQLELGFHFRVLPESIDEVAKREEQEDGARESRGRMLLALMQPKERQRQQQELDLEEAEEKEEEAADHIGRRGTGELGLILWVHDTGALALSVHLPRWHIHLDALFDQPHPAELELEEEHRQQQQQLEPGNFSIVSPTAFAAELPPLLVCPGQWHQLRLTIAGTAADGGNLRLALDGREVDLTTAAAAATGGGGHIGPEAVQQLRQLPIHLGGTTAPLASSLGIRSLSGCVKQLELDGQPMAVEAKTVKRWHKVVPDGCPEA